MMIKLIISLLSTERNNGNTNENIKTSAILMFQRRRKKIVE